MNGADCPPIQNAAGVLLANIDLGEVEDLYGAH